MKEKLRIHLYLMKSSPRLSGVLLFGVSAFLFYFIYLIYLGMGMFDVLSFMAKVNYIFCALLIVIAYLLLSVCYTCQQDEIIDSLDKGNYSYQKNIYFILLLGLLLINVVMIVIMVILSLDNSYFLMYFIKPYLYNIFIPQIICLTLAFVLSLFKSNLINMTIIIVFIFISSPLSEFSWTIQPSFPQDKIYQFIHLPFELFYQNGQWAVDVLYGLQTEVTRLWIFITWGILLLGVYFIKMNYQPLSHSKLYNWGYKATILLIVGSCFMMYMPECRYRLNDAWDGYYYDIYQNDEPTELESEKPDYKITQYDLNIHTQRMLNVEGKLHLQSPTPRKDFVLTLYQNYKLQELSGSQDLTYKQIDDYIYVQFNKPIQEVDLKISYKGYHPRFYSNNQASLLPGYFPWYPMCGERQIFLNQEIDIENNFSTNIKGYNANNRVDKAEMTIHTDKEYITNLNEIEENVYKGVSDSISLFRGYTEKVDYKNIQNYLPLNGTMKPKEKYLDDVYNHYINGVELIEKVFNISLDNYKTKRIIDISEDMSRNTQTANIAIFDDYVIVSQISNSIRLFEPMIQTSTKSTALVYAMSQLEVEENAETTYQNLIKFFDRIGVNKLKDQLENIYQTIGAKQLLHELYKYVFDNTPADDQKFLERLENL